MFTKCPSCHTEISFEPPANAPAGYKHRIKCPNPACGVTISVALPSKQAAAPATPAPAAQTAAPAVAPTAYAPVPSAMEASQTSGKVKYKGRARSLFMLIFSLLFVALNVVAFLIATGKMAGIAALGMGSATIGETVYVPFDGISFIMMLIKDFAGTTALFSGQLMMFSILMYVVPAALLLFAGILALSNLIGFLAGKYGKTGNVIFSLLVFILSAAVMFQSFIIITLSGTSVDFMTYIQAILANQLVSIIAVGVGFLFFIFSIIFGAKKKKVKEPKIA